MKKTMNKSNSWIKYLFFVIIIAAVFVGIAFASIYLLKDNKKTNQPLSNVHTNEKSIDNYGINCDDNDTKLYKVEFDILKENLTSDKIDEEAYAKSVAKLFIIDLYTIKNKMNKYDIGGTEFVLPSAVSNYRLNVEDTIYKFVQDNSDGKRIQNLPTVESIEIVSTKKTTFEIKDDKSYDAYNINLKWKYTNDYGYDTKAQVIVIKKDDKMYVVEKN